MANYVPNTKVCIYIYIYKHMVYSSKIALHALNIKTILASIMKVI
jgi:hypothetical protein